MNQDFCTDCNIIPTSPPRAARLIPRDLLPPLAGYACALLLCQLLLAIVSGSRTGSQSQNWLQSPAYPLRSERLLPISVPHSTHHLSGVLTCAGKAS
jgi:hypothetical protein